jgi:hypothetical protein
VLDFGLYKGWSLGQVARADAGYLAWLLERREGHRHREEIERLLEEIGARRAPGSRRVGSASAAPDPGGGRERAARRRPRMCSLDG